MISIAPLLVTPSPAKVLELEALSILAARVVIVLGGHEAAVKALWEVAETRMHNDLERTDAALSAAQEAFRQGFEQLALSVYYRP